MMSSLAFHNRVNSSGTALPLDELSSLDENSLLVGLSRNPLSIRSYRETAQTVNAKVVFVYKTDFDSETAYFHIESSLEDNPAYQAMIATEHVLRATWDTPEEDEAWAHL